MWCLEHVIFAWKISFLHFSAYWAKFKNPFVGKPSWSRPLSFFWWLVFYTCHRLRRSWWGENVCWSSSQCRWCGARLHNASHSNHGQICQPFGSLFARIAECICRPKTQDDKAYHCVCVSMTKPPWQVPQAKQVKSITKVKQPSCSSCVLRRLLRALKCLVWERYLVKQQVHSFTTSSFGSHTNCHAATSFSRIKQLRYG